MRKNQGSSALALALALALASCGGGDAASARKPAHARMPAQPASRHQATSPAGDTVSLYPAAELARIAATLGHGPTGKTLGASPGYSYIEGRRTVSGEPEVHDNWADIAFVQAGKATLLTGGRVQGAHDVSPGEHRGGTIVGGVEHTIAAGDLYVIPAGTPHQYRLSPGQTLTYLTIKAAGGR